MPPEKNPDTTPPQAPGTAAVAHAHEVIDAFVFLINPPNILQVRNLHLLLTNILDEATRITGAERGTLYLVDHKEGTLTSYIGHGLALKEVTLPIGSGVAGYIVKTGESYNLIDAHQCPFFDKSFDTQTGFRTRALLSAPIKNQEGLTIAVIQLINKQPYFTAGDERFVKAYASYIAASIENAQLYQEREKTLKSAIQMIASIIDKRDPATAEHSSRVSKLGLLIAQELGLSDAEQTIIEYAGLLHDIGKIGVRDAVLLKPGKLDDDEYAEIKRHADYTGEILRKMHWPEEWKDISSIAALHHEKLDGSGYPNKHGAEGIPLAARILAIVDTYDALVAIDRPYKKATPHPKAIEYLEQQTKMGLYDEKVFLTLKGLDLQWLRSIYGDRVYSES